jgi:hypothetical protein
VNVPTTRTTSLSISNFTALVRQPSPAAEELLTLLSVGKGIPIYTAIRY